MLFKSEELSTILNALKNQMDLLGKDKEAFLYYKNIHDKLFHGELLELEEYSKIRESLKKYIKKIKDEDFAIKIKILSNKLAYYIIEEYQKNSDKQK